MSLRIESLRLQGIGPFRDLTIPFDDRLNVICGANGVGKTTILEAIAATLSGSFNFQPLILEKYSKGLISIKTTEKNDGLAKKLAFGLDRAAPKIFGDAVPQIGSRYSIFINAARDLAHRKLDSISRDASPNSAQITNALLFGISANAIKPWLMKRIFLENAPVDTWSKTQKATIELAKKAISSIDNTVMLYHVSADDFEIHIDTLDGRVLLEELSSGYRTVIFIILSIVTEIDARFNGMPIEDFEGVVLIDEIDLHLHPEWQRKIIPILLDTFPKVQFIVTTHSPHVVQGVEPNQVIALARDEAGAPAVLTMPDLPHGLSGWTIDEILRDIMGMPSTQSKLFDETMAAFDTALDREDTENVIEYRDMLLRMLHPNNPMKKLIRMQAAPYDVCEAS